jgi:hypothetical protein
MEKFLNNQQIPLTRVIDPNTGREYYSPENITYDDKNYSGPTTLQGVIVDQAISASYAPSTSSTGSLIESASFTDPNLIFTKGDKSTFNVSLSTLTVTNAYTASYVNGGTF